MVMTAIYLLILLCSLTSLLHYMVDSFEHREYKYTVGFSLYAGVVLWLIGKAIEMLLLMI